MPNDKWQELETSLKSYENVNAVTKMLNALSDLKIPVFYNNDLRDPGQYDQKTQTITLRDIGTAVLEELFHAYQDLVFYDGGIGQYATTSNTPGRSNIEFEAHVFCNIMDGIASRGYTMAVNGDSYTEWLMAVTNDNNGPVNLDILEDGYQFYEEFKNQKPPYNSPDDPSIRFNAIKELLK